VTRYLRERHRDLIRQMQAEVAGRDQTIADRPTSFSKTAKPPFIATEAGKPRPTDGTDVGSDVGRRQLT
jgi:hypothetical protein